jgi:hypothetical protein
MSQPEEWRQFPGWPYEVSSEGRVRSQRTGVIMKAWVIKRLGYAYVAFRVNCVRKNFSVHRLVAIAFHGDRSAEGLCVAHNDGVCLHNRADNLRWATMSENHLDKRIHGTDSRGARSRLAKLSDAQVIAIRKRHEAGESYNALCKEYGVVYGHIRKICLRETWTNV